MRLSSEPMSRAAGIGSTATPEARRASNLRRPKGWRHPFERPNVFKDGNLRLCVTVVNGSISLPMEEIVHVEPVVVVGQTAQEAAQQARDAATAAREAALAREDAARVRDDVRRIREEVRDRIREEMRAQDGPGAHGGGGTQVITVPPPPMPWEQDDIPPHVVDVITMFLIATVICIVGLPIARAIGRWIDRRGTPTAINPNLSSQIDRIEHAVESMAIEVERISEAQRFQAKLLSDREKVRV